MAPLFRCGFQLRHRLQCFLESVDDAFGWVQSRYSLADYAVSIDDNISRESVNSERVDDGLIRVSELRPIHFLFSDKVAPRIFVAVVTHADQDNLIVGIFPCKLF